MVSSAATKTIRARPLSGWALDLLILLDAAHPGVLRFTHQASPLRRQVVFLALVHLHRDAPENLAKRLWRNTERPTLDDPLKEISIVLMDMRVRDIIRALHPGVEGLAGALGRLGPDPLHPLKYRTLVHFLADSDQRRAKVLRQSPKITETTLSVLQIVDPAVVFPDLMRRFRTIHDAEGFAAAVDLIRRIVPGVTDFALVDSLRALPPTSRLDAWAQRWVGKAVFPVLPPIQDDSDWNVLRTGRQIQDASIRFENCLRDKVGVCALARGAYVEWVASEPRAIIELAALTGSAGGPQWVLEDVHGPSNGSPDPSVVQAICHKLQRAGILLPARFGHARRHDRAAPLLSVWDFGGRGLPEEDIVEIENFIDQIMQRDVAA